MTSRRILITGARGYLGGRLIRYLEERGVDVVGTSRGYGTRPDGWPQGVPLVTADPLDQRSGLVRALEGRDVVIHLAAANELRSFDDPDAALIETGSGTRRLIEASIEAGVGRFVFLSTIHVYGAPLAGRLSEDTIPNPIHPYAITHQVGESFTLAASASGRIEGIVVRLSNAIGAPAWTSVDRWTLVGNDFARQAVTTGSFSVNAPEQWRDFIAMSDVCDGLFRLATHDAKTTGIYNLASGCALQVDDIAQRTASIAQSALSRPIEVKRPDRPMAWTSRPFEIAIDRLRSLGFAPSTSEAIDDEILATIQLLAGGSCTKQTGLG